MNIPSLSDYAQRRNYKIKKGRGMVQPIDFINTEYIFGKGEKIVDYEELELEAEHVDSTNDIDKNTFKQEENIDVLDDVDTDVALDASIIIDKKNEEDMKYGNGELNLFLSDDIIMR